MERVIEIPDDIDPMRVFGIQDRHIKRLRDYFEIDISARGHAIQLGGAADPIAAAADVIASMLDDARLGGHGIEQLLDERLARSGSMASGSGVNGAANVTDDLFGTRSTPRHSIDVKAVGRTEGQRRYLRAIGEHDIVIADGPAGTGKTYLAVRMAVEALKDGDARKLILCRPAVEAGENLGFLPGDFQAKVNPFLRPLYDALHSILEYDQIRRYTDREIIEIVPLAYMRGRTLDHAFIILDEGQNTTPSQMKMFLTRMGEDSKIVITGDTSQVDLPPGQLSGLRHAQRALAKLKGIGWIRLTGRDIVRHPLVAEIVKAYEDHEGSRPGPGGGEKRGRKRK